MKKCGKCNEIKKINDFYVRKKSKDGYNNHCKDCINKRKREWELNNPEKVKNSYEKNKEKIIESRKNWALKNKEYIKNYKRKYSRSKRLMERMENDELLKSKIKISKSIGYSIKKYVNENKKYSKKSSSVDILGCTFKEFKIYIESKFKPWMTWKNYGKYNGEFDYGWDFDHIIPLSSVKTKEDIYKLNHYSNFQPLCSKVNRDIKRNYLDFIQ